MTAADKPGMLQGILKMQCPSCRNHPMYKNPNPYNWNEMGTMYSTCPVCGYNLDREAGYFFGAMYVSYAMMVAWNIGIGIIIYILKGSIFDHFRLLMLVGGFSTLLISPVIFRYSRVIWCYIFFKVLKK